MGALIGGLTIIALIGFVFVFAVFAGGLTLAGWNLFLLFTGVGSGWNVLFALVGFWLAFAALTSGKSS